MEEDRPVGGERRGSTPQMGHPEYSEVDQRYEDVAYQSDASESDYRRSVTEGVLQTTTPPNEESIPFGRKGVGLEVTDVSFYVKQKRSLKDSLKRVFCGGEKREREKPILHHAHATIPPGSLTAIMGPSGAGKSTLMDVLANRKKKGRREGAVLVNGVPQTHDFRRSIAYCTQEDILIEDLTVAETLYFGARLLLPSSLGVEAIRARVDSVISSLRLDKVRDSVVGGLWKRGISGGEKRRLSIGLELLTSPHLLLGDELTSGLDSFSAYSVMKVLSDLARDGNTVVLNIHQPSSTLFGMFDNLILLCEGRIIYEGPVKNVGPYFSELGFACPPGWAMADFLLELVSRCGAESSSPSLEWLDQPDEEEFPRGNEDDDDEEVLQEIFGDSLKEQTPVTLGDHFLSHRSEISSFSSRVKDAAPMKTTTGFPNSWFHQVMVLIERQLVRWYRNPMTVAQVFIMYLSSALIIGLLYSDVQEQNLEEQYTLSLSFSLDMFGILAFLNIAAYLKERAQFARESSSGYYYTSAYYFSGFITSSLMFVLVVLIMCAMMYFLIGYPTQSWMAFLLYFTICYINLLTYQGIVEWLSATFTSLESALLVTGNMMVITMTLSGVCVNFPNIPVYLRWLYWANHMTYLVSALLVIVFKDYKCASETEPHIKVDCGQAYLDEIGIQIQDVWVNIVIAIGFLVIFRIFTYLSLRFLHREH